MHYTTASFYDEFHCIGGICEDSCCENWEIDLDDESIRTYKKQKGPFGKRLHENMRVKDKQFILNGTRCPFLNDKNLCDIYIEIGESCLCETCTNFPRHVEEFDDLKEVSLTMSCPEASRIMLGKKEKMTFVCKEGTDEEYGLKHINPVRSLFFWKKDKPNTFHPDLFHALFEAREYMFQILQNREMAIANRAAIVLKLAYDIQEDIDSGCYSRIKDRMENSKKLLDSNYFQQTFSNYQNQCAEKEDWMKQVLNMYKGLETIKEEWETILSCGMEQLHPCENYELLYREFVHTYKEQEYEFEHILVYYLFNYFLGASYDLDALTKVKFAMISFLVILELDVAHWITQNKKFTYEDQVLVAHAYSKEVEHSYNNFESLQLVLSAHPILDFEHLMIALLS